MLLDAELKARNSRRRNRSPSSMAIVQKKKKKKKKKNKINCFVEYVACSNSFGAAGIRTWLSELQSLRTLEILQESSFVGR